MLRKRFALFFLCVNFFSCLCYGQYYGWGTEPTWTTWRQINTENFQIIYPRGSDSVAQVFANKLNYVYSYCSKSLNHEPWKRISVILHDKSNISNGSVAWCPSQMDVYSISSQSQHPQEWYEHIAIHEYRHVVQTDKLNQGLTQIFYILLGEQAVGAVSGLYCPMWLLEGDAVCTETALSQSGRGRQADFSMGLRAQTYDKGVYSYSKAYFGSYGDYVPNYYEMGYFLLANSRKQYGQGLEAAIFERAAQHPLSFRPLNRAIKDKTGLSKRDWYLDIFNQQATEWKLKHDREIPTNFTVVAKSETVYTNYINGTQLNDSVFFVERNGLDRISQLVKIENGKEKVIRNIAFKPSEERVHSNGKSIVWEETNYDIRWEMKQNSFLYVYDIEKNKTRKIRTHKHVFAPAISPSNERIVVSEVGENDVYYLTIYDKSTREIIKSIKSPDNDAIIQPSWNQNGSKIVFVGLNSPGKRIMEYDVLQDSFSEILPYSNEDYNSPLYWQDYFLYTSSYSGVDNIYALNKTSNQIFRVTVGEFGCKFPSITDSTLVYSNYTSDGYQLVKIPIKPESWHPLNVVKKDYYNLAQMLTNQEGGAIDFSKMEKKEYSTKYYSKLLHVLNIHSWMPFCMYYNGESVKELGNGIQFLSQNKLGTTNVNAGYKWNKAEGSNAIFAKVSYRGLFPVFELDVERGNLDYTDTARRTRESVNLSYKTNMISALVYLPFNFSSKSYYRNVILASQYQKVLYDLVGCPKKYINEFYETVENSIFIHYISASNLRKQSTRELYPRYGQKVLAGFSQNTPGVSDNRYGKYEYTPYYFANLWLYFPGIQRDHSFNLYGGYEKNESVDQEKFEFLNRQIQVPRGLMDTIPLQKELYSFKVNYAFPISYPDIEWGNFMYIKRVRCNAFLDYAIVPNEQNYLSYGAELIADFHMINLIAPVNAGLRYSFLPDKNTVFAEILLSFNFSDI